MAPVGHLRVAPELRAPVYCPVVVVSGDPLLEAHSSTLGWRNGDATQRRKPEGGSPGSSLSPRRSSPLGSPLSKSGSGAGDARAPGGVGGEGYKEGMGGGGGGVVGGGDGSGRRRREYVGLYTSDGKPLAEGLLPSLVPPDKGLIGGEKGTRAAVTGGLNPTFARFEAPGNVVLQVAPNPQPQNPKPPTPNPKPQPPNPNPQPQTPHPQTPTPNPPPPSPNPEPPTPNHGIIHLTTHACKRMSSSLYTRLNLNPT
jgi:hypothetical protein